MRPGRQRAGPAGASLPPSIGNGRSEGQARTRREHTPVQTAQARFRDVAAPCNAAHSCWRQSYMHAMDDMDVPVSVKYEDGERARYEEREQRDEYEESDHVEVLRVSALSRSGRVAGAIAGVIRTYGRADVQAIGAGATNQAIKAIAIARDYLQPDGLDLVVVPTFVNVRFDDEVR